MENARRGEKYGIGEKSEKTVGLSMMRYTEGKASSACFGERQLRGLIGKLLY